MTATVLASWKPAKLSTLVDEVRERYEPSSSEAIPYLGLGHIQEGSLHLSSVGASSDTQSTKKRFRTGDILFGTLRPYFRKVVRPRFDGVCSTDITVLRPKDPLDGSFVLYFIANPAFIEYATATSSGTRMPRAKWSLLAHVDWAIPAAVARRKIGAILSAYDDLIKNNRRRIQILEEMARLLYREWFVHFRFPGHEGVRLVAGGPLGPIPEGWEVVPFGDIAHLLRNGIKPAEFEAEVFEHFSFAAFDNGALPVLETGESIRSSKYMIHEDCVLLAKLNPRIPRVWLAFTDSRLRSITSTEFLVLVPKAPLNRYFLFSVCRLDEFLRKFSGLALGTSTSHQRVKPDDLLSMSVARPKTELICQFGEVAGPMLNLAAMLRRGSAKLSAARDLLLPKLISGEIDVADLDIDTGELEA